MTSSFHFFLRMTSFPCGYVVCTASWWKMWNFFNGKISTRDQPFSSTFQLPPQLVELVCGWNHVSLRVAPLYGNNVSIVAHAPRHVFLSVLPSCLMFSVTLAYLDVGAAVRCMIHFHWTYLKTQVSFLYTRRNALSTANCNHAAVISSLNPVISLQRVGKHLLAKTIDWNNFSDREKTRTGTLRIQVGGYLNCRQNINTCCLCPYRVTRPKDPIFSHQVPLVESNWASN